MRPFSLSRRGATRPSALGRPAHVVLASMTTGLPVGTQALTLSTSALCMRTQPWLMAWPMRASSLVPWMATGPPSGQFGSLGWKALRPSARTP